MLRVEFITMTEPAVKLQSTRNRLCQFERFRANKTKLF